MSHAVTCASFTMSYVFVTGSSHGNSVSVASAADSVIICA
jgi:hypothetical protein